MTTTCSSEQLVILDWKLREEGRCVFWATSHLEWRFYQTELSGGGGEGKMGSCLNTAAACVLTS